LVEKQLTWLNKPAKMKKHTEQLTKFAEEEQHLHWTYHTNLMWTCTCCSYLVSHFLHCKHLVWAANAKLNNAPLTDLAFYHKLCQNHSSPYYSIPGIHTSAEIQLHDESDSDVEIKVLKCQQNSVREQ